ncbi:Serine/threonine-protein kinase [Entomophthora muscae]|uniref:Serine/threonine-protein kinase n=1 Tax=Entomophthora muscae TaxID=34485 RepID=A0ACC2RTT1_9FUNG|nr:Serine/threonine-protein kinase [Entomophthora muscae]
MGNQLSGSIPSTSTAGIDSYIDELNGLTYIRSLGSARFLKTIQGGSKAGPVVIKILVKPSPNLSFRPYIQALKAEQEALRTASNVFSYQCQLETDRAVYVVRQYFHASLYDRISTRPFLILVEKKFITFQLLRALADCHARKVCHGDIKTENVLVTSWNWAYLSDFASFKPTYLPEDNPGDFSFFFDTSSRRSCYLSPERFYDPVREPGKAVQAGALPGQSPGLHPSMDVFAMGCVIGELFLESSPTFLLSQLLSYKRGEYDPAAALQPIECPEIRSLVLHMIQSNPADRLSASEYLEKWCASGGAFPSYFSSFLYPYLSGLTDASVASERPELQSDARILKLAKDFERISGLFGFVALEGEPEDQLELRDASDSQSSLAEEGAVLLGSVLMALTRSCALPSSQIQGLEMLLTSSVHLPDNLKLDRAIPYLLGLCFESSSGLVRAHSLTVLIQILASVNSLNPINFPLFSEYLLPHLRRLVNDPEVMVRVAYARNIATLAQVAARFARLTEEAVSEVSVQSKAPAEDEQLGLLDQVVSLLIDPDSGVKRALLGSMPKLCVLFGHAKTNDVLLSHMITYLNDRDWMLRCSFFEDIVGVAEFVGRQSLEEYILPLMIQAITDGEEFVVEKVLCSLTCLARAELFSKMTLWELITVVTPQLGHPNIWVRNAAASFASAASFHLTFVDQLCVLAPSMEPFLRYPPLEYPTTPADVVRALGTPIPRVIFDEALNWAAASLQMWDILQRRISKQAMSVSGVDADWLRLLDSLRWTPFDEQRILAMRECIVKLAKSTLSSRRRTNPSTSSLGTEVRPCKLTNLQEPIHLQSLGVNPHTEFFSSPSANSSLHASSSRNRPIEPK